MSPPPGTSEHETVRPERILLLMDSDAHHLFYVTTLLQRFKYRVCAARTAGEARDAIARSVPALVLAEENPRQQESGIELLQSIRKQPRLERLPAIAMTESGDSVSRVRCHEAGFIACLNRPVVAEELFRAVQAAVEPTPRSNMRVQTRLPVVVNGKPLDCVEGECVSVISEHGMYIRTLTPHPKDARLSLAMSVHGRIISADAVVLYCHQFGEGPYGEPGMGLVFSRIAARDREHLRSFIIDKISGDITPDD